MGRRARKQILYDGCYAHVFSRALGKEFVFVDDEDFNFFKGLISRTKVKYGFRIHHYCLLNTHFHLAVSIPEVNSFSAAMKEIKQRYVNYVTKTLNREGPMWWGRFRSQLIEDENYLYACGLYIEQNPIKAGKVGKSEEWPHSSARHYLLGKQDSLVDSYEQPTPEKAKEALAASDFAMGSIVGSALFQLQIREGTINE